MMGSADPSKDPAIFPYVVIGVCAIIVLLWGGSLVLELWGKFKQWRAMRHRNRRLR